MNHFRKLSLESAPEVIELYLSGKSSRAIAPLFGVSPTTIDNCLIRNGIPRRSRNCRKYDCDDHFFKSINTEEKAYWVGFLWADGNIFANRLSLTLATRDIDHITKLKESLNCEKPICSTTRVLPSGLVAYESTLAITSPTIVSDLARYDIVPRKTYIGGWPPVPDHLLHHCMRGMWDGDGGANVSRRPYTQLFWYFTGHVTTVTKYKDILVERLGLSDAKLRHQPGGNPFAKVTYGGRLNVTKLYNFMFKDASVWLPRKKELLEREIYAGSPDGIHILSSTEMRRYNKRGGVHL